MSKKTFQDVVPPARSIRNIEVPSRRGSIQDIPVPRRVVSQSQNEQSEVQPEIESKKFERKIAMKRMEPISDIRSQVPKSDPIEETDEEDDEEGVNADSSGENTLTPSYAYTYDDEPKKLSRMWLYVASAVLVIVLAFGISALFKSAKITVTPKTETRTVTGIFTAQKDATTGLGFQIVTITEDTQTQVAASGSQQVSTKASGTIIVYNNTATPQKLIATTRFQTSAGLIFRLVSPVTIPGNTTVGGKSVAGSVEAKVQADAPGVTYNIPLSDFTLPALKGDPKYTTIYARSKTAMTGGFVGQQKKVAQSDISAADTQLQTQLQNSLNKDIISQIPANFILYTKGISYTFSTTTQAADNTGGGDSSTAVLQKKGTAQAIIFDKTALSQSIVGQVLPDAAGDAIKVDNLDALVFAYATTTSNIAAATQVSFNLTGDAHFVWTFDANKLKSDLLGLTKVQAQSLIAKNYKAIQEDWIETRPFWNQIIPLDTNKVTLINTLEK